MGTPYRPSSSPRTALALDGNGPSTELHLLDEGIALYQAGRFADAEQIFRQVLDQSSDNADAWHLLGMARYELGFPNEAIDYVRRALTISPQIARFHNNLGTVFEAVQDLPAAAKCFAAALAIRPDYPAAHNNLGEVFKALGDVQHSNQAYREALKHSPAFFQCRSNLLMGLNYDPDASSEEVFAEHRRYGELREAASSPSSSHSNDRTPTRRLRIGYVSPDFRKHAVTRFFEPILSHHDRKAFDVHLYAEVLRPDPTTERLRGLVSKYVSTVGKPAELVARMIRADGIDILVDLAGHTRNNRLDIFAERPAPIQATYLGYSNTTGLSSVGYRISDAVLDPIDRPGLATEQIVRLPRSFACFLLPSMRGGTAASFGGRPAVYFRLAPSADPAQRSRAAIVAAHLAGRVRFAAAVPAQQLSAGTSPRVFRAARPIGLRAGSNRDSLPVERRVELFADLSRDRYPARQLSCDGAYANLRSSLDGCSGGYLRGDRPWARLSASVLHDLNLDELVATDAESYLAAATRLAADPERLRTLRGGLRDRMQSSLCDGTAFTTELEQIYRQMWTQWCSSSDAPANAARQPAIKLPEEAPDLDDRTPISSTPMAGSSSALNDAGITAAKAGDLERAKDCFDRALVLSPEHAGARNNLGNVLKRLGRLAEAELQLLIAMALDPHDPSCQINLASVWRQQKRLVEAMIVSRHALAANPRSVAAHRNLAELLVESGEVAEAIALLERALAIEPNNHEIWTDLANQLVKMQRFAEAETAYRRAIAIDENATATHANLAHLLGDAGDAAQAGEHYRRARTLQASARLRLAEATVLPPIYDSLDQLLDCRRTLQNNLANLEADGFGLDPTREVVPTLFYLAYQGLNDRPIHETMARLARPVEPYIQQETKVRGRKIRVGFLSHYLCAHTIGHLNCGGICELARDEFEVVILATSPANDAVTRRLRERADRYLVIPQVLSTALKTIAEQQLDVLFYTDVGMDPFTYTLAFSRLAPVQCVTWGHPVTTGLPTIDYFVSSEHLETTSSTDAYSERLARLPMLGVYYEVPELPVVLVVREQLGLPSGPLYVCPQTLFKFHPDFDAVLGSILRRQPAARLVLIQGKYPRWTEMLKRRFATSLADVLDRIVFLPPQPRQRYLQLLAATDVMLDPLHFGGGNSSYEALSLGLPIVTLPSGLLRGRLTYAMYRQMGIDNLIAESPEHYADLAVGLIDDTDLRQRTGRLIRDRKDRLFCDSRAVRSLEEFIRSTVSGSVPES